MPEWEDAIVEYMFDHKIFLPKFVSTYKCIFIFLLVKRIDPFLIIIIGEKSSFIIFVDA